MTHLNNIQVWTALITPFDAEGQVDYESLQFCIRQQESAANGILLLGSTGEGLALSLNERKAIVSFSMNMNLSVPVMVGVGGFQLTAQLEWLLFCAQHHVDAYLLVHPLYAKPGPLGQLAWFEALLNAANAPCMLYNVPSRTGGSIDGSVLTQLANHPNLWALKEASGSAQVFQHYYETQPNLRVYCGDDGLMPEFSSLGAAGLVSVIANAWPQAVNNYVAAFLSTATNINTELWKCASAACLSASNPVPIKCLLAHLNWIQTNVLRPPLSHQDLPSMSALIAVDQHMNTIFNLNLGDQNDNL